MSWKPIRLYKQLNEPYRIHPWGDPVLETELEQSDCDNLLEDLKRNSNIPADVPIFHASRSKKLRWEIILRKTIYTGLTIAMVISSAAAILISIEAIKQMNAQVLLMAGIVLFFAPLAFIVRKLVIPVHSDEFENYLNPNLTAEQRRLVIQNIIVWKKSKSRIFWSAPYQKLFRVTKDVWNAPNWFMICADDPKLRGAIWLSGTHPLGPISIEKSNTTLTPNSRDFTEQTNLLGTSKSAIATYNKLNGLFPKQRGGGREGLKTARTTRANAIEFITQHPELWDQLRQGEITASSEEAKTLLNGLAAIFEPIAKKDRGQNLAFQFMDLKDRKLDEMFREIKDKIIDG